MLARALVPLECSPNPLEPVPKQVQWKTRLSTLKSCLLLCRVHWQNANITVWIQYVSHTETWMNTVWPRGFSPRLCSSHSPVSRGGVWWQVPTVTFDPDLVACLSQWHQSTFDRCPPRYGCVRWNQVRKVVLTVLCGVDPNLLHAGTWRAHLTHAPRLVSHQDCRSQLFFSHLSQIVLFFWVVDQFFNQ